MAVDLLEKYGQVETEPTGLVEQTTAPKVEPVDLVEKYTPEEPKPEPTMHEYIKYKLTMDKAGSTRSSWGAAAMYGRLDTKEALLKGNEAFDHWKSEAGDFENVSFKEHPFKYVAGEAAQLLPYMIGSQIEGVKNGLLLGMTTAGAVALAGQVPPFTIMPEEVLTVPATFASMFSVGYSSSVIKYTMDREGGGMYLDMIAKDIPEKTARPLALAGGLTIGIIELMQFKVIAKPFQRLALAKMMKTSIGEKAILAAAGRYFEGVGVNVVQEELQEIVDLSISTIAGTIENNPNAIPTKEEWRKRLLEVAARSTAGLSIIQLPGGAVDVISSGYGTQDAKNAQDKMDKEQELKDVKAKEAAEPTEKGVVPGATIIDKAVNATTEDLVLNPEKVKGIIGPAFIQDGKVYGGAFDVKGYANHADVFITNKLDQDKAKPGFLTEDGNFVYQYEEDLVAKKADAELDPLTTEAKKYKTAEEFVKAQTGYVVENVKISSLPERATAIGMPKKEFDKIAKSIKEKGVQNPIIINKETGDVIDGMGRAFVSQQIGLKEIPAIRIDPNKFTLEEAQELGNTFGKTKSQLTDIWNKAQEKAPKPKPFEKRLQEIKEQFKRPETIAKKEVKLVQEEIIRGLEESDLEASDKAKFIKTIKNIQTSQQLQKALPEIGTRVERLVEAESKRTSKESIKKQLKTTKPLKVGQKRVGKFDYETNKTFDELRSYNKLSKTTAQTELDKLPAEPTSELGLIKTRFLSLKANGATASAEIHKQVLADIKRIKKLGKEAKDQATLEKLLNRQELVDNALASIDKITGTKDSIMGKVANAYRRGFSNISSMLNSIGGKKFESKYEVETKEDNRDAAVSEKTLVITQNASRIYDEKNIMRLFETMSLQDYKITDTKDGLTVELSKLELIDIYNSIKNEKKRNDYYEAFGKDSIDNLMGSLTAKDVEFADALQQSVQEYREILNKRNIEITGRDLGFIENYWPATSEHTVSVLDDMKVQGETPSALKERAKGAVIPVPKNAWYKAQRHIGQGEHVDKLSREYESLKRLFSDRKVKHAMTKKYGKDVYNTLLAQIENISLNKQSNRIDAISSTFQKAINNWVTAKIALNPSTFVRQLMSVGNYAENMNAAKWTVGFFDGIIHPKRTFDYMWNNAPFLKARFNRGYNEALAEAMEGAKRISVNKHNYTKTLTALVRAGDIAAIIYGGYPLMKEQGLDAFHKSTLKSQQSGLSSSISQFQNSKSPFTRLFLAFKNTSNQYFRKMGDAVISYQAGDMTTAQFAKTMTIYAVIQPIAYVSAGAATATAFGALGAAVGLKPPDDPEEIMETFLNDLMVQLVVSPVNSIPLINDIVRATARKATGQKVYQWLSIPWLDDLERAGRAMHKAEVTGEDYLKLMSAILEPATALPLGTGIRYFETLTGKKKSGKKEEGFF